MSCVRLRLPARSFAATRSRRLPREVAQSSGPRVAGFLKSFRQRFLLKRKPHAGVFIHGADRVELMPKSSAVAPREQSRTRGTAVWRCNVTRCEANTCSGNSIDVRCWDLAVPLTAQFAISQIIREQNDHVGHTRHPVGSARFSKQTESCYDQGGDEKYSHFHTTPVRSGKMAAERHQKRAQVTGHSSFRAPLQGDSW
jgi:hypothetical protein